MQPPGTGRSCKREPLLELAQLQAGIVSGGDPRRDRRGLASDLADLRADVRAADTFSYDPAIGEDAAREMWMVRPPGRTTVAVDDDGTIVGTANMYANRPGPGDRVASGNYMSLPDVAAQASGRR